MVGRDERLWRDTYGLVWRHSNTADSVAIELHCLGLQTVRVVAHAVQLVGDAGPVVEELIDNIAPDDGVAGLEVELVEDVVVAWGVNLALDTGPLAWVRVCGFGAGVVRVVEVLDYSLAGGFEDVLVGMLADSKLGEVHEGLTVKGTW